MERVVNLHCAKCRTPFLWTPRKSLDNRWLFEKCKQHGLSIFTAADDAVACSCCGQPIALPRENMEFIVQTKGVELTPDTELQVH